MVFFTEVIEAVEAYLYRLSAVTAFRYGTEPTFQSAREVYLYNFIYKMVPPQL